MKNTFLLSLCIITVLLVDLSCTNNDENVNRRLVHEYYRAYEKKDWGLLKSIITADFKFCSPNDDHIDLDTYHQRCWPNAYHIKKFDIDKLMVDGNGAFVIYNGRTNDGRSFRNTEYFAFRDGKIKENFCFFGPGVSYPNNTKSNTTN